MYICHIDLIIVNSRVEGVRDVCSHLNFILYISRTAIFNINICVLGT